MDRKGRRELNLVTWALDHKKVVGAVVALLIAVGIANPSRN